MSVFRGAVTNRRGASTPSDQDNAAIVENAVATQRVDQLTGQLVRHCDRDTADVRNRLATLANPNTIGERNMPNEPRGVCAVKPAVSARRSDILAPKGRACQEPESMRRGACGPLGPSRQNLSGGSHWDFTSRGPVIQCAYQHVRSGYKALSYRTTTFRRRNDNTLISRHPSAQNPVDGHTRKRALQVNTGRQPRTLPRNLC